MDKKRQLQTTQSALETAEAIISRQKHELEQSKRFSERKNQTQDILSIQNTNNQLQAENERLSCLAERQAFAKPPSLWYSFAFFKPEASKLCTAATPAAKGALKAFLKAPPQVFISLRCSWGQHLLLRPRPLPVCLAPMTQITLFLQ